MEARGLTAAVDMMLGIIMDHREKTGMWNGAKLEAFRNLDNTTRGEVGEQFVIRYMEQNGISARRMRDRPGPGGRRLRAAPRWCSGGVRKPVRCQPQERRRTHAMLEERLNCLVVPCGSLAAA